MLYSLSSFLWVIMEASTLYSIIQLLLFTPYPPRCLPQFQIEGEVEVFFYPPTSLPSDDEHLLVLPFTRMEREIERERV